MTAHAPTQLGKITAPKGEFVYLYVCTCGWEAEDWDLDKLRALGHYEVHVQAECERALEGDGAVEGAGARGLAGGPRSGGLDARQDPAEEIKP